MTSLSRMGGCSALIAAATLTGLLAGCANASSGAVRTTAHAGDLGPVAGSRALAVASAQRLLGLLVLPAGSRRLPARPVPPGLSQPGVSVGGPGNFLDQDRLYRLPLTVTHAITFLRAHELPGTVDSGTSGGGNADGVTITAIAFTNRSVPPGINQIDLVETLTPEPGGSSLLRADAQVLWYPPRSAAEYLIATRFRSVRITLTPSDGSKTVQGGQRTIRALVAVLNSMHATPRLIFPCPMEWPLYKLVFAPAAPAQRAVIVQSDSCGTDQVSVGGRPQPELFDTSRLRALVTRLGVQFAPAHGS
jgi:hypothetical protein